MAFWRRRDIQVQIELLNGDSSREVAKVATFRRTLTDADVGRVTTSTQRFDCQSGCRFQAFRMNNLELVDQIFGSWNRLASWLRDIERVRAADISTRSRAS
jgi:hypothetical protein